MNKSSRPKTPAPVAHELRVESGFGCCVCGLPIYRYHHIIPYSSDPHFRADDMMVLCPNHHAEADAGAMSEEKQREFKERPVNIGRGFAEGLLRVPPEAEVIMGTNLFRDGSFIRIDGEEIFALEAREGAPPEISLTLYDASDQLLVLIDRNEWVVGDPLPWDLEARFQFLKLRHGRARIALKIDARSDPVQLRAQLFSHGQLINVAPKEIQLAGKLSDIAFQNCGFTTCGLKVDTKSGVVAVGSR